MNIFQPCHPERQRRVSEIIVEALRSAQGDMPKRVKVRKVCEVTH